MTLDLRLLFFGSALKLVLEFFDLLGNGFLTAREVFETIEHREILLLLGGLRGVFGGRLFLVLHFLLLELEIHVLLFALL